PDRARGRCRARAAADQGRGAGLSGRARPGPQRGQGASGRRDEREGRSLMKTVSIISVSGEEAGTVELPDNAFDVQANVPLMHQAVLAQQAAARQGTHSARTRGQVRGGGKKPYRQKGTGRARQGSIRAPQYVGGGTAHGPVPRSYQQRTPKRMKAAALRGAL